MKKCIRIRQTQITNESLFIIAEVGNQFNGDVETAKQLIDAAKDAGADAVKFIFWFPDELMADKKLYYEYDVGEGITKSEPMFDLLNSFRLEAGEWREVRDYALKKRILFMSTINSPSGIDLDDFLMMDAVKISSWDYNFPDLWGWIASQFKPLFIDTGPVTEEEIEQRIETLKEVNKNPDIVLLHCFHTQRPEAMNMMAIPYMAERFDCLVGYSSTDYNDETDITAVSLGACVLEKRLTLSRKGGVLHDAISKEPDEFKAYVEKMHAVKASLGQRAVIPSSEDLEGRKKWFRRIVADTGIRKGETITRNMLEAKRGETGESPEHIWDYVGKVASRDIERNETIYPDSVAEEITGE